MKFETGKEDASFHVGVLIRLEDIAAVAENEVGDSGNQAFLVGTGH
jgi:hypothetical protein